MNKAPNKATKVMLLITGIFLIITIYTAYYRYSKIQKAINTTGKITGFREETVEKRENNRTKKTTFYYPNFEFKNQSGTLINIESNVGKGNSPDYSIGEEIEIMYSPTDSHDAQINSFFGLWLPTFVLSIFTIVFSIVTYIIIKKENSPY
jgi:preprotein translocase subunit SecG